ncbi:carbonic anhydrase [Aspergillus piperis CBS 112811]|uniref:Carbonic anhydrase n=1 Tax=Aspergillus piperis CBS 112811 TaxID=1448313 RepID=A0A8G1VHM5_9EURO|nr:carbonic anhydrase [Aspergillus piperis CBS 112811]RAH53554.1 carbonic anhydrase [Aspergillus piperis CBS 112811]
MAVTDLTPQAPKKEGDTYTKALTLNHLWAAKTTLQNPSLFPTLARAQHPQILWIGCSDSRCPETTFLDLNPGDVFVHRNIANVVNSQDVNCAAVVEYAVCHLRVKHVVVCGHTCCGGVGAVLAAPKGDGNGDGDGEKSVLDAWLRPVKRVRDRHASELGGIHGEYERGVRLVELNVLEGVRVLKGMGVVREAVERGEVQVHGVVYDVGCGVVRELEVE